MIAGGSHGIKLRAQVNDRPLEARQVSFVASNRIYGTSGVPILVEATGEFVTASGAATVVAEPLVIGNTLTDGGAAGLGQPDHVQRRRGNSGSAGRSRRRGQLRPRRRGDLERGGRPGRPVAGGSLSGAIAKLIFDE